MRIFNIEGDKKCGKSGKKATIFDVARSNVFIA